jgi:hypothetical protein
LVRRGVDGLDFSRIKKVVIAVPNAFELWARELVEDAAWLTGVDRRAITLVNESTAGVIVSTRALQLLHGMEAWG